jgi:sec-independent protein translocase protein TatA
MLLAFLNLGASEMILILVLLLLLFGADKAPQLARSLGKARSELERAKGQFNEALKTEEDRAWDEQLAFEKERERKIAEAAPERQQLVGAAEAMGLQTQGLTDAEIKAAMQAKLGK